MTTWVKIDEVKGKMWNVSTYYPKYGSTTKYARKEVWTPTSLNKDGKKHNKYFKSI